MGKYLATFRMNMQKTLMYRARFFIWIVTDMFHLIVFPFLWLAIYGTRDEIGGYSKEGIVTYYVLMTVISILTYSHVFRYIHLDIMKGFLNKFLVRPVNHFFYIYATELAWKFLVACIVFPLLVIFSQVASSYLVPPASLASLGMFALFFIFSSLISTLIQFIIGYAAFWFQETNALYSVRRLAETLFAGQLAPLVFFPPIIQTIAYLLPFQYLAYVPAQLYLGQLSSSQIIHHILAALVWILILGTGVFFLWRHGVRRYDGVGI